MSEGTGPHSHTGSLDSLQADFLMGSTIVRHSRSLLPTVIIMITIIIVAAVLFANPLFEIVTL